MMGEMVPTRNSFLRNSHPALEVSVHEELSRMRYGESSAMGEAVGKASEKSPLPKPQVTHEELARSQHCQESPAELPPGHVWKIVSQPLSLSAPCPCLYHHLEGKHLVADFTCLR